MNNSKRVSDIISRLIVIEDKMQKLDKEQNNLLLELWDNMPKATEQDNYKKVKSLGRM